MPTMYGRFRKEKINLIHKKRVGNGSFFMRDFYAMLFWNVMHNFFLIFADIFSILIKNFRDKGING